MRKTLCMFMVCCMLFTSLHAQFQSKKKGSLIGFAGNMMDFNTAAKIKADGLGDALRGGWGKIGDMMPGFSLMYWQGLTNRLDFSGRYNLMVSDYTKSGDATSLTNEFEAAAHLRALTDDHVVNPFLTAGIGIGNYGHNWAPYSPLGVGVQFNIKSNVYLFLQGHYRVSYKKSAADDNLFYSFGITERIFGPKEKQKPVVSVPIPVTPPPPADSDEDGIIDSLDKCPQVKGIAKYDGCPIPDTDGDGINDEEDKCPNEKGIARYQGCPVPDQDNDGVNDEEDKCPTVPGLKENNGCPEIKEETVKKINYSASNILFATGSYRLLPSSGKSLDEVVNILNEDPELKLDIEGHTDNTGTAEKNLILSEQRARAVAEYLQKKGIAADRLSFSGFGQENPVADNKTAAGRNKNRRVELKLKY